MTGSGSLSCPECGAMFHYKNWLSYRKEMPVGNDFIECPQCDALIGEYNGETGSFGEKDTAAVLTVDVDIPDTDVDVPDVDMPSLGSSMARVSTELGNAKVEVEAETAEEAERIHKRRWQQVMEDAEKMAKAARAEDMMTYQ